jgi:uncharacterized membrane protein (DUF106 family)
MSFLDTVLNPVLLPLATKSPLLAITLVSLVMSLLVTLIYKYFTNQPEMKRLKEQQKEHQKRMKELRSNPEEAMKLQKEMMRPTMDMFKHSMKAMIISTILAIILLPWMYGHLAYDPIKPGETYSVTATFAKGVTGDAELIPDKGTELLSEVKQPITDREVTWRLKSTTLGEHNLTVKTGETEQTKIVLVTTGLESGKPVEMYKKSDIEKITVDYQKFTPLGDVSLLGWQPGWLGIYIITSIIFSLGLRKLLNVH